MDVSAENLYTKLASVREPFLRRAREAAQLTIPSLLREEGHTQTTDLLTPWQSVGARAANNLSAKLLLTLFPPSVPFFRLRVDEVKAGLVEETTDIKTEIEESLADFERLIMFEVETTNFRVKNFEAFQHLLVAGNALLYMPEEGGSRVFHLDTYVVDRDPEGTVNAIVIREAISPLSMPERVRAAVVRAGVTPDPKQALGQESEQKTYYLFTAVVRSEEDPARFETWQEIAGQVVDDTEGEYTEDDLPYLPLRMYAVDGEDYGRGLVEQYIGDLKSLEGLSAAIVEAAAASARVLVMVRKNSTTRLKDVAEAANGAVVPGSPEDVGFLQAEKQADLRVAAEVAARIEQRLSFAFLLNTSVQRQAERVTAEEIRFMAQELEDALGGVYSVLTQEMQLPMVRLLMRRMEAQGRMPKLNPKVVKATVVTGLESLGRGHDLQRLQVAFDIIARTFGPEALVQSTNPTDGMRRIFTALGIDSRGLLKTEEEVAQVQQQAQMSELGTKVAPEVVKQMGQQNQPQ